jgi:hypothetical protein
MDYKKNEDMGKFVLGIPNWNLRRREFVKGTVKEKMKKNVWISVQINCWRQQGLHSTGTSENRSQSLPVLDVSRMSTRASTC